MEWSRGAVVGRGSFGTVSLAFVRRRREDQRQLPPLMAVKSAPLSRSAFLQHENSVLSDLQGCPQLVRCFGHDVTADAGAKLYNLFLEYVAGGTLSDVLRRSGGPLREPAVRRYTRSILRGLSHVHSRGYAHCDIKLQNILVDDRSGDVKIADFGLAKKIGEKVGDGARDGLRGTPLYMSPESVARSEHGAPADIWSVGCVVAEMVTAWPAWRHSDDGDAWGLLFRIGFGDELPQIPSELSEEGKDFLRRCFVKDPAKRWTAEMLLRHPFMALEEELVHASADAPMVGNQCVSTETSPRSVLGLSQWLSPTSPSSSIYSSLTESVAPDSYVSSPADRIGELATSQRPNWSSASSSSAGGWIDVRVSDINFKSEEQKHQAQETKRDSMLKLEEMLSRNGCGYEGRPERVDELLESNKDVCSTATIQLSLPLLAFKHEDRTECASDSTKIVDREVAVICIKSSSLGQTGWLDLSSFFCLTQDDCKTVSALNGFKYRDV